MHGHHMCRKRGVFIIFTHSLTHLLTCSLTNLLTYLPYLLAHFPELCEPAADDDDMVRTSVIAHLSLTTDVRTHARRTHPSI